MLLLLCRVFSYQISLLVFESELKTSKMVAAEFSEQLKKSILLAADRFQLLISDVPFEHATPPPISPDKSEAK